MDAILQDVEMTGGMGDPICDNPDEKNPFRCAETGAKISSERHHDP